MAGRRPLLRGHLALVSSLFQKDTGTLAGVQLRAVRWWEEAEGMIWVGKKASPTCLSVNLFWCVWELGEGEYFQSVVEGTEAQRGIPKLPPD